MYHSYKYSENKPSLKQQICDKDTVNSHFLNCSQWISYNVFKEIYNIGPLSFL